MTSNTAPSGVASANSTNQYSSNYAQYTAFNRIYSTGWNPAYNVKPSWIAYKFPTAQVAKLIEISFNAIGSVATSSATFTIQASNDDWTTPIDLTEEISLTPNTDGNSQVIPFTKNVGSYLSYRIYFTSYVTVNGSNFGMIKYQLYTY